MICGVSDSRWLLRIMFLVMPGCHPGLLFQVLPVSIPGVYSPLLPLDANSVVNWNLVFISVPLKKDRLWRRKQNKVYLFGKMLFQGIQREKGGWDIQCHLFDRPRFSESIERRKVAICTPLEERKRVRRCFPPLKEKKPQTKWLHVW